MDVVNVKYLNMGKKGYPFSLSMSFFSCNKNSAAKGVEKTLDEFHFQYLSTRVNFDSKGYVKQYLYGAKNYMQHLDIEDFWEDCLEDIEVYKRSFTRLTLKQIRAFGIPFNVPDDAEEEEAIIDPEYHTLVAKPLSQIDWSENEISDLMVCTAPVLRRTSDWLNGKWQQNVNPAQEQKSSSRREQGVMSTTTVKVSMDKLATKSSSQSSQSGGYNDKPEEIGAKLKAICEQDDESVQTKGKTVFVDSEAIYQQIIDDNFFPPLLKIPTSPIQNVSMNAQSTKVVRSVDAANKYTKLETSSPAWLKMELEKKRKSASPMTDEIDTVALLPQGSRKPNKAKRMYQIISEHQLLEIVDPVRDMNENEIT